MSETERMDFHALYQRLMDRFRQEPMTYMDHLAARKLDPSVLERNRRVIESDAHGDHAQPGRTEL